MTDDAMQTALDIAAKIGFMVRDNCTLNEAAEIVAIAISEAEVRAFNKALVSVLLEIDVSITASKSKPAKNELRRLAGRVRDLNQ